MESAARLQVYKYVPLGHAAEVLKFGNVSKDRTCAVVLPRVGAAVEQLSRTSSGLRKLDRLLGLAAPGAVRTNPTDSGSTSLRRVGSSLGRLLHLLMTETVARLHLHNYMPAGRQAVGLRILEVT